MHSAVVRSVSEQPTSLAAALLAGCLVTASACATGAQSGRQRAPSPSADSRETDQRDDSGPAETTPSFERALDRLESGEFDSAESDFRALASARGSEPLGRRASLYAARASIGPLRSSASSDSARSGSSIPERAVDALRRLASQSSAPTPVVRAAQIYRGLVEFDRGDRDRARELVAELEGDRLEAALLDRDRPDALALVADAWIRAGRRVDALRLAGRVYEETRGATAEPGVRAPLRTWSRVQAFRAVGKGVGVDRLRELGRDEAVLVRAAAGAAFVEAASARGSFSNRRRGAVDEIADRAREALETVGADDRAQRLTARVRRASGSQRLVLAAVLPLSGGEQAVGRKALEGVLMGVRALRFDGRPRVTVVFVDSNRPAEEVVPRLVEREVSAVVGPLDAGAAQRYARELASTDLPMIALTSRPVSVASRRDPPGVFRHFLDPGVEARAVASISLRQWGDRRAAVLHPANGYGRFAASKFTEAFRQGGGEVAAVISYDRETTNFSSMADRVAELNPDAIFIPDSSSKVAEITSFLADSGVWGTGGDGCARNSTSVCVHYLGTSLWHDPMLVRQSGKYVRGAAVPAWFAAELDDRSRRQFGRRFRAAFDRGPGPTEAFAFDSVRWVRELLLESGVGSPAQLRRALASERRFDGATGVVSFGSDGAARRELRFLSPGPEGFDVHSFGRALSVPSSRVRGGGQKGHGDE